MNDDSATTSDHEAPTAVDTAAVTVEQAAAILGVSVTTVRRRNRAGALRAEEARRPQGPVWLVYLPSDAMTPTTEPPSGTSTVATAATTTPQADAMVSLIQTTIATVLGPLVTQLDAQRQTIERQNDALQELEHRAGRYAAELDAAEARYGAILAAQSVPAPSESPVPVWRRWWPLALGVAGFVVIVVLLVWPR